MMTHELVPRKSFSLLAFPGLVWNVLRRVWDVEDTCPVCGRRQALENVTRITLDAYEQQGDHPSHQEIRKVPHSMPVGSELRAFRCRYCGHEVVHAVSDDDGGANDLL